MLFAMMCNDLNAEITIQEKAHSMVSMESWNLKNASLPSKLLGYRASDLHAPWTHRFGILTVRGSLPQCAC